MAPFYKDKAFCEWQLGKYAYMTFYLPENLQEK